MDSHLRRLGRPVRAVMLAIAVHVVLLVLLGLGFYFQPTVIQPTAAVPMNAVAVKRDQTQAYSAIGALVGRIGAKVRENWNKPPGTMTGLETVISVKVERTGEVVSVKVVKSSGNDYFDQSAENAVYKASPLPFPDEPRYYEFIKEFNFKFVPDRD